MSTTISVKRAQRFLEFSIKDDFSVTGAVRYFGRLPDGLAFKYEADKVYFKSLDGSFFIRFYVHPEKPRILVAESSHGDSIDLYFRDPTFGFAVDRAQRKGRERTMGNGRAKGWGKHVVKAWECLSKDFEDHGIDFSADAMQKIKDAAIRRRDY